MTLSLQKTTTNVGTKSDDDQIETVPLAGAPAPTIVNVPTSAVWFEADDTQQSEKMETKSNKTIEVDPIDTTPPRILYSQVHTKYYGPGHRPSPQ
ncbi:9103_t:CDS:2, partial [Gigaspora rosea]